MERYNVRASDGVEYGPCSLDEVMELIKQGRVKATTMIFTQSTARWHLACSIAEVRPLLRKYNPSQNSALNRIRAANSNVRDSAHGSVAMRRISTIRVKHPFWKKLFNK